MNVLELLILVELVLLLGEQYWKTGEILEFLILVPTFTSISLSIVRIFLIYLHFHVQSSPTKLPITQRTTPTLTNYFTTTLPNFLRFLWLPLPPLIPPTPNRSTHTLLRSVSYALKSQKCPHPTSNPKEMTFSRIFVWKLVVARTERRR